MLREPLGRPPPPVARDGGGESQGSSQHSCPRITSMCPSLRSRPARTPLSAKSTSLTCTDLEFMPPFGVLGTLDQGWG